MIKRVITRINTYGASPIGHLGYIESEKTTIMIEISETVSKLSPKACISSFSHWFRGVYMAGEEV